MVVEDEPNIGALVRTYLERAGYHALWVRSGEDALTELRRHPVKLSCWTSACRGSTASRSAGGSPARCR